MDIAKNTICLWYDKDAETAARFYAEVFPDSSVSAVHRAPSDFPSGKAGEVLTVDFTSVVSPASVSMADRRSNTMKPFRSKSPLRIRKRLTGTGMPSSAMVAKKVRAAGARTNGGSPGKSRRAC